MEVSEARFDRLLDRNTIPTPEQMNRHIGAEALGRWQDLTSYLDASYDFQPELRFFGLKYGWCLRYRRKGRTLCVLFPERDAFTVLVVFGLKEREAFETSARSFNADTRSRFAEANEYRDGRWVYKRVQNDRDLEDTKRMIAMKRKPKGEA